MKKEGKEENAPPPKNMGKKFLYPESKRNLFLVSQKGGVLKKEGQKENVFLQKKGEERLPSLNSKESC